MTSLALRPPAPATPSLPPPAAPPRPGAAAARLADAARGEHACVLALRHAGPQPVRLRHESVGPAGAPSVFVAGGISADAHAVASARFPGRGWWDAQAGPGRALDPARHRLLGMDWLGADGALDHPLDPADQADAIAVLLDVLGIPTLEAFIGCSYGAMVGLHFAARHPQRLRRLVAISGTHRAHPHASAWRALQRRALDLGALQCDAGDGLALARQMAMLSYRTPADFDRRFGAATVADGVVRVAAEDYLDHCGARYAARTTPTAFRRLSESIDLHRVDPGAIRVPTTLVAVAEDRLVPVEDAYALAEALGGAVALRVLRSPYGHDAFLKEHEAIADVLRRALGQPGTGTRGVAA